MIYATRIRMKPNNRSTSVFCSLEAQLLEIDEIFLSYPTRAEWVKRSIVHDFVESGTEVHVNIAAYPKLIATVSSNDEKYVRSSPNSSTYDNLLSLPRE